MSEVLANLNSTEQTKSYERYKYIGTINNPSTKGSLASSIWTMADNYRGGDTTKAVELMMKGTNGQRYDGAITDRLIMYRYYTGAALVLSAQTLVSDGSTNKAKYAPLNGTISWSEDTTSTGVSTYSFDLYEKVIE